MTIREKNEQAFEASFHKGYFGAYKKLQEEREITNCCIEIAETGEEIICCLRNGRKWRLNSIYEPERAAELYALRYTDIRDYAPIGVFGLSDGRTIRALLKYCNETQTIIVYEPDVEIFLLAMRTFDLSDLISNVRVFFVIDGLNQGMHDQILSSAVMYQNRGLITHCILPNYDVLYNEKCNAHIEKLLYFLKLETLKKNTELQFATRFADNIFYNMPYLLKGSSLREMQKAFAKLDLHGIPAIIVSAGPSLDKNIKQLKNVEGKAFIIGVDSALKALVREGIKFQLAVSIDPRKNPDVFDDDRVNDFPYLVESYSLPLIAQRNRKRLIFEAGYGFKTFDDIIQKRTGKILGELKTGGSVATDALSLAIDLGFDTIILVGQDLAFTDGRGHVSGFEKSEEANRAHVESRELAEVDAYYGGKILTDVQMASYLEWFEMRIDENKEYVTFYNATEGGAMIHGATPITLENATKQLCVKKMQFDDIIMQLPDAFTMDEQEVLLAEMKGIVSKLGELEEQLQDGIEAYQKLIYLEQNRLQRSPEYREVLVKVKEINHIEETSPYMSILKLYAKKSEYAATTDIYEAEEMSVEEIAKRGMQLLKGYIEGCSKCKAQIEEILLSYSS